jgi:hypothetical protein
MNRIQNLSALVLLIICSALTAGANTAKLLDFSGLATGEQPLTFYSGGTGSYGSSLGLDYGITFSSSAEILTRTGLHGNFLAGTGPVVMNVTTQFANGLKFNYLAVTPATVSIWSGPDGTGFLLGTLTLGATPNCVSLYKCWWGTNGLNISSTASSVTFVGAPGEIGFDNIRIGKTYKFAVITGSAAMFAQTNRVVTPEPSSLLLVLTGILVIPLVLSRRKLATCPVLHR